MRGHSAGRVALAVLLLLGCATGQAKKDSTGAASALEDSNPAGGFDAKGWGVTYRRAKFVFTEGRGRVAGGYLWMAGLANLDRKLSIENHGEGYFSKVGGYKSVFYEYGRMLHPSILKIRGDNSANLIVEPLTKEDQQLYNADPKQYAINQLFFDGLVAEFLARPKDKLMVVPNESVRVRAFNKTWEFRFAGTGLGEVTVETTGFVCGSGVACGTASQ